MVQTDFFRCSVRGCVVNGVVSDIKVDIIGDTVKPLLSIIKVPYAWPSSPQNHAYSSEARLKVLTQQTAD